MIIGPSNTLKTNAVGVGGVNDDVTDTPSAQSDASNSTVRLSIYGDQTVATETGVNTVAYREQTVTVELDNISQYFLKFYGNDTLTAPAGGETVVGTGTSGVVGKDIKPGTWGYAWDENNTTSSEEMIYYTVPTTSTDLTGPEIVDNTLSFTGKLNFAANFPSNATLGSYTSHATLTLIATPKANTGAVNLWRNAAGELTAVDAGTDEMQGAGLDFCSDEVGEGWTIDLRDNRDREIYTIVKLKNGDGTYSCWMQQNLRLKTDNAGGLPLASGDTDLTTGTTWTLPKSLTTLTGANFSNSDYYKAESYYQSGTLRTNGAYYSWTAATAGAGGSSSVTSGNMAQSICPKGWHLPTGGSDNASNEFYNLLGTNGAYIGASNAATAFTKIQAVPYLFPAAGFVERGLLYADGSGGLYWSSAAYSDTAAYHLRFYSSNFIPGTDGDDRSLGFSVRCVADPAIIWENNGENQVRLDSGLKRMQDITKTNFTEKYCTRSQDSIVAVGATVQLQDARDGETYTIVKLPDGHCWMQQNLRLGSTSAMDLKPSDTNITGNWTLPAAVTTWKTGDNTVVQTRIGNTSLSGWQAGWGNYYSWCAATAGTCSESTANNVNVSGSICPKGWHLPSGGSTDATGDDVGANSELYKLANELNMNTIVALPYLFPAASGISESYGSLRDAGTSGHYWSRTSSDSAYAYFLSFSSGRYPYFNASRAGAGWNRYFGFSVRCLADY